MTEDNDIISIQNLNKWFGNFHVLRDINLTVRSGEKIVICGPSGSGKSTLIRCINRLEVHQEGEIIVNGVRLDGSLKNLEEVRSEVGMLFQQFNLFPHMTVLENCALAPLIILKRPKRWPINFSRGCVFPIRRRNIRASFPVGNSSAWRLRARCA